MVRRTREDRLNQAIESAEALHAERVAWIDDHVAKPVRQMCGIQEPFTDANAAGSWITEQVRIQTMDGDRFVLHLPRSDALARLHDDIKRGPERLGIARNESLRISPDRTQAAYRVDGYTGTRHPLDRFDVARFGVGPAFRSFTRDVLQRPQMQPLARLALASLIVERLLMCEPAEAAHFLLTGRAPAFVPIRADVMFSWGDNSPSMPAVFIVSDPWMTAEQVGTLVARARDHTPIGKRVRDDKRLRRPDAALDYLIAFVDERRPVRGKSSKNMTWEEVTADWERLAPAKHRERVSPNLRRAYSDAAKLRVEKGLLPAKGGETS